VRVHADASAQRSAREVDALAYTVGRDIVFGAGQYAPGTRPGMRLLAHELAHVVQQSQAPAHVVQRQPAPPQAPRDEAPEADAPPTGAAAAPNLQMPTCQATGVSNWIKDPQKPAEEVFGLTELTGSGGTSPELRVGPSDTGKGFVVLPTGASLGKPIAISYMRPGRYPEHAIRLRTGQPGDPPGGYRPLWNITQAGSDAIKAGEQEHCDDYRAAFYFSLYRYAEIVNEIAAQKTVYPTEAAAKRVLDGKVFIDAKKLPAYFKCLADDMRDQRDQRTGGWHTPRKSQPELTYDSALSDHVAVRTLTEKSLPEVGRHGTGELPFRHAAPACVGLTTLPTSPTLPKNTP
jgi:hypothetical protein